MTMKPDEGSIWDDLHIDQFTSGATVIMRTSKYINSSWRNSAELRHVHDTRHILAVI
jgi:hypothetical protein